MMAFCDEIKLKNISVFEGLATYPLHPKMVELMRWIAARFRPIIITCAYEKRPYRSVHSVIPVRGIDIRSWVFNNPQDVVDKINQCWEYNDEKPDLKVALYHDSGRGEHIHLQIHDNSILKKGET